MGFFQLILGLSGLGKCEVFPANLGVQRKLLPLQLLGALTFKIEQPACLIYLLKIITIL